MHVGQLEYPLYLPKWFPNLQNQMETLSLYKVMTILFWLQLLPKVAKNGKLAHCDLLHVCGSVLSLNGSLWSQQGLWG